MGTGNDLIVGLINNAALLLALGLVYDVFLLRRDRVRGMQRQIGAGIVMGSIGIALMFSSVAMQTGVIFDTRSVILAISGLFFGFVPTLIGAAMMAFTRYELMGGQGAITGVIVIVVSALIGLAWRRWRPRSVDSATLTELYIFGMVVHLAMVASMLTMPAAIRFEVIGQIVLPVLLVYPAATAILGRLMVHRFGVHQAERDLERNNILMRTVIDNIPGTVFVKDRQGRKILANAVDVARTGLTAEEVLGKTDAEIFPPDEAERYAAIDRIVLEEGREITGSEEPFVDPSGETRWMLVSKHPLRDEQGEVTGLVGVGHDITAPKREEQRLRRAVEIQNALGGIATRLLAQTDSDSAIKALLRELGELTGACRTYYFAIDESAGIVDNTHEWCAQEVPSVQENMRKVPFSTFPWMLNRIVRGEVLHFRRMEEIPEEAAVDRDALEQMGIRSIVIFPIFQHNHCTGFIGITAVRAPKDWDTEEVLLLGMFAGTLSAFMERQAAERDRVELERQILQAQKLESLGVLAGGIAHDFNNILMAILGHADLALEDLPQLSPARGSIQEIEKASRRAAELCRQMLAYSGKGHFVIESIHLGHLVEEMVHLLRTTISKKVLLNLNLEKSLPPTEGDATQLRQVIMNLVINASEAIGDRSGVITISTGAMDCTPEYLTETYLDEDLVPGLYVSLEVSDTGCGMDRETQSRIFEPFFTTKFTGRGLGMAAVLGIVRGHKGALKVYSEPNKGTTFKLLFPAAEEFAGTAGGDPEAAKASWKGDGLILLVDDEETIRALGKRMLERMGFEVITAEDGRVAMEIYEERGSEISLVVLDLTMPHMNGEETFRALRGLDPGVRVILSSGYTEHDIVGRFAGKGLAGFIPKPYTMQSLRDRLRAALERSEDDEAYPLDS